MRAEQVEPPFLQVENLHRAFHQGGQSQAVLSGLAFTLRRGESMALLGRSGCGKSTLLNLLSGIDRPDAGRILLEGRDLGAMDERERTLYRRRHIGFVYQFFNLVPGLNARENIAFVLELNGSTAVEALRAADAALAEAGLGDKASLFPAQLSGGEQQRVAILRALIHRPALVLADEPTGNLDAQSGMHMLGLLHAQVREAGSTLVLVTHSLAVARSAARVLTLDKGVVKERVGDFAW